MRLQMRDGSRKGSVIAGIRMPFIQSAGVLSYILLLVMRIPLSRNIGDAGMGLFAPAFEIFLLVTFLTSYSMAGAMTGVIRYRVKREQHKNARRVFGAVFTMDVLFSIVVAAGLVLASAKIADILVLEPASRMAILAAAPTIVFAAIIGTFRGYFSGYGLGTLSAHSQYIEKTAMIFCTLACSGTFYKYGNKVAALVQRKEYSFAYGALGAMVGVMLSQVITVIYLLAVYVLFSGATRGKAKEDNSKRAETRFSIQRNVLLSCLPTAIVAIFTNLFMLVDQRMFNYCMNRRVEELGEIRTAMWGAFYSKFAVLTGVAAAICLLSASSMTGRIKNAYDREEYRIMRERMGRAVGRLSMVAFPVAIYLAALAEAVVSCLFKGETEAVAPWIQKGAVVIVLCGFGFFFAQLLLKLHMLWELLISVLVSLAVHLLTAYLFVQKALLGADGVIYAMIAYFAVFAGLNFVFLSRNLKYRQSWLSGVAFPAAAAVVSGLAVMLIGRFMLEPAGAVVTIITGIVAGVFLDLTMLMVLRVIGEEELSRMPFGFFFIMFGKNIGVL